MPIEVLPYDDLSGSPVVPTIHHLLVAARVAASEVSSPVDDATGAFTDPELGALYTKLVAKGQGQSKGCCKGAGPAPEEG